MINGWLELAVTIFTSVNVSQGILQDVSESRTIWSMFSKWDQTVHQQHFKWRNVIKKLLTPLFRMLLSIHPSIDFHSQLHFYLCFIIYKIVVIGYWYWMLTAFSLIKSGNYFAFWTPIWQSAGHFMQIEMVMRFLGLVKCLELPLLMVST